MTSTVTDLARHTGWVPADPCVDEALSMQDGAAQNARR
jgi:hypothetical protein